MEKHSRIYVAGHKGMVGSSMVRKLYKEGYSNLILKTSSELDLRVSSQVESFFEREKPEYIFLAAAKVGGIMANNMYKADFLYDNLMIQNNVIHNAYRFKVKKLLFFGSSCIYPARAPQPLKEAYILTGTLEPTNEPYAIAKIAGIKMCDAYRSQYGCNFISCMPTNLYGPNDNYDLVNSHVLPAMIRKFHEAKRSHKSFVELWGTGTSMREFLHVDDLADASFYLMQHYNESGFVNVGCGKDLAISDLALLVKEIVGYKGEIKFDATKPDGTSRKLMDVTLLSQKGWTYKIMLEDGIRRVYDEVKEKLDAIAAERD